MNSRVVATLALALLPALGAVRAADNSPLDGEIPIAPIPAATVAGVTNVFELRNAWISAAVAPDAGRIIRIDFNWKNDLLRMDAPLLAKAAEATGNDDWRNYGGDWLWPVSQSRWKLWQDNDWPPPAIFRNIQWKGQAWESQDGSKYCLLGLDLAEPLNIRVRRLIRVDAARASIDIRQRIERTAPSTIPVCLWNISQIVGAERVVVPVESNGYRVIAFAPPGSNMTAACERAAVINVAQGTEHKIGSDSPRAWIAAQKGDSVILEYAVADDPSGDYPDSGCRVEMYANKGLGYTEIETLSAERNLEVGERLSNTLRIECYTVATNLTDCELADRVRALRGEVTPAPVQAP